MAYFDLDSEEYQMFTGTGSYPNNFKTTIDYENIRDYRIKMYLEDGLHPNTQGYLKIANNIGKKLTDI